MSIPTPENIADATVEPTAPIGHNEGPAFDPVIVEPFTTRVKEWADAGGDWLDLKQVTTEEQAQHLADFIAGARKLKKEIEDKRKATKEPFLEAGRSVDSAFRIPVITLETTVKKAKALLDPYLVEKQRRADEEKQKAEKEAARKRAEAERAARAAHERNDIAGQVAAEEAQKEADKEAKAATKLGKAQVKSASGGGRTISSRKVKVVTIDNLNLVFMHYRGHPKVKETLQALVNSDVRSADVDETLIPGISITEETRAQ